MNLRSGMIMLVLVALVLGACQREEPATGKQEVSAMQKQEARELAEGPERTGLPEGVLVYQDACASCHETGIQGAPITGSRDAWSERLIKGPDALVENTIVGIGNMPPRGGVPGLSDAEIKAAVHYMINQVH